MALALIVLAIGSVLAGYVGVPAALGGHDEIEHYLAPSFSAHQARAGRRARRAWSSRSRRAERSVRPRGQQS